MVLIQALISVCVWQAFPSENYMAEMKSNCPKHILIKRRKNTKVLPTAFQTPTLFTGGWSGLEVGTDRLCDHGFPVGEIYCSSSPC